MTPAKDKKLDAKELVAQLKAFVAGAEAGAGPETMLTILERLQEIEEAL